jgi:hypothetical protein
MPKTPRKKNPEVAESHKRASHESKKSASSLVELVYQSESGTFVASEPEDTGSESQPSITPDAADQENGGSYKTHETGTEGAATSISEGDGDGGDATESGVAGSDAQQTAGDDEKGLGKLTQTFLPVVTDRPTVVTAVPRKRELSDDEVDEVVHKVIANRDKADKAQLDTGFMLLDYVFGGSLKEALSRNPKKQESFEKICDHPDMDIDATTLSRWVKAANLVRTFEKKGKRFNRLTCSHYITLLSLKKDDNKLRLAEEAEENGFSVRRLAIEVGRVEPAPSRKLIDIISGKLYNPKELANQEKSLLDKQKWAKISPQDLETLKTRVSNAKVSAQTYINRLARFHRLLEEISAEAK